MRTGMRKLKSETEDAKVMQKQKTKNKNSRSLVILIKFIYQEIYASKSKYFKL